MDVEKTKLHAYEMFNKISKSYDFLNALLSLGFDKYWRKSPLKWLEKDQAIYYLDVASGTGDQLLSVLDKMPNIQKAFAIDPAIKMLEIAEKKIELKNYKNKVECIQAKADQLPFENEYFDFSTMTFGLRNLSNMKDGIKELYRVTKQAGQVHIIEFGKPHGFMKPLFNLYLKFFLPFIGKLFSKHQYAYTYLHESIQQFESNDEVTRLLFEGGFQSVFRESLFFGIINHFVAIK